MPSYEFKCQKCGKRFTRVMSISEYAKGGAKCPKCGSKKLQRVITSVQVQTARKS